MEEIITTHLAIKQPTPNKPQANRIAGVAQASSMLSKKRFKEISKAFTEHLAAVELNLENTQQKELVEALMKEIAKIMNFDEHAKAYYDPMYVKKRYENFKIKATEQGVPISELNGHKAHYLKNKTELNKKQTERNRKNREISRAASNSPT